MTTGHFVKMLAHAHCNTLIHEVQMSSHDWRTWWLLTVLSSSKKSPPSTVSNRIQQYKITLYIHIHIQQNSLLLSKSETHPTNRSTLPITQYIHAQQHSYTDLDRYSSLHLPVKSYPPGTMSFSESLPSSEDWPCSDRIQNTAYKQHWNLPFNCKQHYDT